MSTILHDRKAIGFSLSQIPRIRLTSRATYNLRPDCCRPSIGTGKARAGLTQGAAEVMYGFRDGKYGRSKESRLNDDHAGFEAFRIIGSREFE